MVSTSETHGLRDGKDVVVVAASDTTIKSILVKCPLPCAPTAGAKN